MARIAFKIEDDTERAGVMSERKLRSIDRDINKLSLIYWQDEILRRHFTRSAYGYYYNAYRKMKVKRRGNPLVRTGRLMRKAHNNRQITGTFRAASLTNRYGRPGRFTQQAIHEAILIEMTKRNITYKQAQGRVYATAGYGKEQSAIMNEMMTAVNKRDMDELIEHEKKLRRRMMVERASKRRRRI